MAEPVYSRWDIDVYHGDCLDVMRALPDASIDAVITDPPYGLSELPPKKIAKALTAWLGGDREYVPTGQGGFMGRKWDEFVPPPAVWDECFRVLKPGGHLLSFAGSRTADLMGISIRLAGFEFRDTIDCRLSWYYGSGFPKSRDVSVDIDRMAGAEREVIGYDASRARPNRKYESGAIGNIGGNGKVSDRSDNGATLTAPATVAARQWHGWGTALKPSHEPIIMARKPLTLTVAGTVLEHGTGALNIAACKVGTSKDVPTSSSGSRAMSYGFGAKADRDGMDPNTGRWPPNVVLSHSASLDPVSGEPIGDACADGCVAGCAVAELDAQSGTLTSGKVGPDGFSGQFKAEVYGTFARNEIRPETVYGDSGGASRFFPVFRWESKAPPAERPRVNGVAHPTCKPLELMKWLARLITPPGGTILDCFAGTGTTGQAARAEGFPAILIEQDPVSIGLIKARLDARPKTEAPADNAPAVDDAPVDLFDFLGGGAT